MVRAGWVTDSWSALGVNLCYDTFMKGFMMLMHADTTRPEQLEDWGPYLERLRHSGTFLGGSALGAGSKYRTGHDPATSTDGIVGYLVVRADSIDSARRFLGGNPVYEAGGTVEIRELIED